MAKRLVYVSNTFAQQALNAAVASNDIFVQTSALSQLCDVLEILISGTSSASTIGAFGLVRCSTSAATPTTLVTPNTEGPMYPNATALTTTIGFGITATTPPIPSNAVTNAILNLGLNTFGGIIRWNAAPTQQWQLMSNVTVGQCSVLINMTASGGSATAPANAHIMYEPY
jgi:hypothetical protein